MKSRSSRITLLAVVVLGLLSTANAWAGSSKKGPKIAATDQCVVSKERSVIHVLLDVAYTKPEPMHTRYVYQLVCEAGAKECSGVQLYLSSLDKGNPIGVGELSPVSGAKIVESTATSQTIKWGPARTFTIDWKRGEVQYAESGEGPAGVAEGKATTKCQVDDFRKCTRDEDCYGGLSCANEQCMRAVTAKPRR